MLERFYLFLALVCAAGFSLGCATKVLEYDHPERLKVPKDLEKKLDVKPLPAQEGVLAEGQAASLIEPMTAPSQPKAVIKSSPTVKKRVKVGRVLKGGGASEAERRMPLIEDIEGFTGRRPNLDPYRVGEKVTLGLTYFNVTAGTMDMEVLPFVQVNGAKAYSFRISIASSALFSRFYSVEDSATTYVNFETLVPYNFEIAIKESNQLGNIRSIFDWQTNTGQYWSRKVTKDSGEEEKSYDWKILPFSQNVISVIYYLRAFTLRPGKTIDIRVADDGKNLVFKAEVLRQEKLSTEIGDLDTLVIKPTIEMDGTFKPIGDFLLWLTNDDRKHLVRIESKIRIGTIVGKVRALRP